MAFVMEPASSSSSNVPNWVYCGAIRSTILIVCPDEVLKIRRLGSDGLDCNLVETEAGTGAGTVAGTEAGIVVDTEAGDVDDDEAATATRTYFLSIACAS